MAYLIKTIVTSNMADAIAKYYGIRADRGADRIQVYRTADPWILSRAERATYLFGFEESYGCLIGTHARDKDAIVATMALWQRRRPYYKTQGKTLWDAMVEMYERYGYYKDDIKSISLKGIEGLAEDSGNHGDPAEESACRDRRL